MPKASLAIVTRWLIYMLLRTLLYSVLIAVVVTATFYMYKGAIKLNEESIAALSIIFESIFSLSLFIVSIPLFVLSIRTLHNQNINNYCIVLLSCQKEPLQEVSLDDAFRVARRWLVIAMWILIMMITLISSLVYLFNMSENIFAWMHYLLVYTLFMSASMVAFFVLIYRCQKIEIHRC